MPPPPCAAAQAQPRLAGPGKEAPGDWPRVTCMGGAAGDWRLASLGVKAQGAQAAQDSHPPTPPPRELGEKSQGNSLHQLARHHLILAAPELRSSMLITDGFCQKVVPVAGGRWKRRKHYRLPVNKSLGVSYLLVERPWACCFDSTIRSVGGL